MRKCPNCQEDAQYAGQLLKCESCGSTYCTKCPSRSGGGCPYCGSHEYKSF